MEICGRSTATSLRHTWHRLGHMHNVHETVQDLRATSLWQFRTYTQLPWDCLGNSKASKDNKHPGDIKHFPNFERERSGERSEETRGGHIYPLHRATTWLSIYPDISSLLCQLYCESTCKRKSPLWLDEGHCVAANSEGYTGSYTA